MVVSTDRVADMGARLREERERCGISQRELAKRLGVSASLISQIETGQSKPSVVTLYAYVSELGVSLDRLFDPTQGEPRPPAATTGPGVPAASPLVRPEERLCITLESGVRWERLTREPGGDVDFLHVVYEIGGASSLDETLMRHPGTEYGHVISGKLCVQLAFERYVLEAGDSISFDSARPHRFWNVGDEPVHGIWFVRGRNRLD